jgi:DNA-directed RNA polymerase subunit RPC12/RpoP
VGRELQKGELGKLLNAIEKKYKCPACPALLDSDKEARDHFVDEHHHVCPECSQVFYSEETANIHAFLKHRMTA